MWSNPHYRSHWPSPASIYMLSITDFDPKGTISEVRVHARLYLDILDASRSPNAADSPRSSRAPDRLITMVKLKKKFWKKEKKTCLSSEICEKIWWKCYPLRMRGCLCESCKREVGKEFFARGSGLGSNDRKNTCVYLLIASGEGTSDNRLWGPLAYALIGQKAFFVLLPSPDLRMALDTARLGSHKCPPPLTKCSGFLGAKVKGKSSSLTQLYDCWRCENSLIVGDRTCKLSLRKRRT